MSAALTLSVQGVIAHQLAVSICDVKPEALLHDDLGADHLDLIELTIRLEQEFGIEIGDNDIGIDATAEDVRALVERKGGRA